MYVLWGFKDTCINMQHVFYIMCQYKKKCSSYFVAHQSTLAICCCQILVPIVAYPLVKKVAPHWVRVWVRG